MKKNLILCCALLGSVFTTSLFAESNYVTIEENNGNLTSYLLDDAPVISYTDDSLIVSGSVNVSYLLESVGNYHFTDSDVTSVAKIKTNEVRVSYTDNLHVQVEGLTNNTVAYLYSTDGSLIDSQKVSADGMVTVTLPSTKGIYLLKINNQTCKILKK